MEGYFQQTILPRRHFKGIDQASISICEDVFILAYSKDIHCTYPIYLSSWLNLTLHSNRCFNGGTMSEARLSSEASPLPKTATIDLVMREARLWMQCPYAFLRLLSFPQCTNTPSTHAMLATIPLMSMDYNFVAREPAFLLIWLHGPFSPWHFPALLHHWSLSR